MSSDSGHPGDLSVPQSNAGSMTTALGMRAPLSRLLIEKSLSCRAQGIAEEAVVPVDLAGDGFGVGVEEKFRGVEAVAVGRIVGAVDAVAVQLSGLEIR